MKVCYCCKQEKPLTEFPLNRTRPDGRFGMCKACKKVYNVSYYKRTKERHNPARRERVRRVRAEAREKVYEYLRSHPCVDCGETDIVVLDFDHQGDKVNTMSLSGFSSLWWRDLAFCVGLEARRDSW
jgi:hypothetical protein